MTSVPYKGNPLLELEAKAGCLALRFQRIEEARAAFTKFLGACTNEATPLEMLQQLKGSSLLFTAALRMRQQQLFLEWLQAFKPFLTACAIEKGYRLQELEEYFTNLVFACCDRRLKEAQGLLRPILEKFFIVYKPSAGFYLEWCSLIARLARRGWQQEVAWLTRVLAKALLLQENFSLWRQVLLYQQMHFEMYCRRDGFQEAFVAYRELHYTYLLLIERAWQDLPRRRSYLLLTLRGLRDLLCLAARAQMLDEMEVFKLWYSCLSSRIKNPSLLNKAKRLVQLVIYYWQLTQPRSSRKQLKFLQELLEPGLLSDEEKRLVEEIS